MNFQSNHDGAGYGVKGTSLNKTGVPETNSAHSLPSRVSLEAVVLLVDSI